MTIPIQSRRPARPARDVTRLVLSAGALALALFILVPWLATLATDWLWYREVGFESVFLKSIVWRLALFLTGGTVAFAFVYGNLTFARRGLAPRHGLFIQRADGTHLDIRVALPRVMLVGSLIAAGIAGLSGSALWLTFLRAFTTASMGTVDPVFGRDISFYLMQLPAIRVALGFLIALTTLTLVAVVVVNVLRGAIVLGAQAPAPEPRAARHVGALLVAFLLLNAVHLWVIGTADLLNSTTGPLTGASYTDIHVGLPGIRIAAIAAVIAAAIVAFGAARGRLTRSVLVAGVVFVGTSLIARGIVPAAVQRLVVAPNELAREAPYLRRHIAATRQAWGLDSVETRDVTGDAPLTMADIRANGPTIDNVRLWERDLLGQTFGQLQEIRTYYDFVSVDDDRYMIDGKYRQVHLSARELNTSSLPTRTFINERLTFTHGMGVTMAPVNQVTSEGLPVLFIKDLPPTSSVSLRLTRPQIYYGELTDSYVFAGTGQQEFDYPEGEANVYTKYTGRGGVPIGGFWRRALYAWQFGSLKILLSNDIAGSSARVLYRRNIMERARTVLPFLDFDHDPYLVINDAGQLKWMLDAYTSSSNYPYAQPAGGGLNYLRNSVKVVIDAYDGAVTAYISDPADPIIRTYARIFEGIFMPLDSMPADLRRHVRYPGELFQIQAALHATYHMTQPETFYHREDQWQAPSLDDKNTAVNPFMRHIILRLQGEKDPEFIFMTPFTPRGKDNLAAWMVARMDGANYGKLAVYRFPKQSLVYGPRQIANRINQDTDISRQITLWDQRGSQVIRGELLVIPIEQSLIYVQPLYLRAEGGRIPELKRIIVAHGNRVVMDETLDRALATLFGGANPAEAGARATDTPAAGGALSAEMAELFRSARDHYERATAAQRAGNWAEYGREIDALGAVLLRLHPQ
jgi:uncharacterized protein